MHQSQALESTPDGDERRLITASLSGDQDAFRQLVEQHHRLVINVAYRAFGDLATAEDLAQEVFLKVYQSLHTYRYEKPFIHWLHRVAANAVTDALRRRQPLLSLDAMEQMPPSRLGDPQDITARNEVRAAVRRAVANLPTRLREAVSLQVFHELSYEEIAQVLEIPMGTVMSRIHAAKRRLREVLADLITESGMPSSNPVNKP